MSTISLIKIVEDECFSELSLDSILDSAVKNKILLHVLRALNFHGALRVEQESRMRRIIQVVEGLSKALKDFDYAFFKLVKPVAYVPADVDVLIGVHQAVRAAREIVGLGFRVAVKDPYCITFMKADLIIDLYVHPSLGGVVFLNGQKLLEHVTVRDFYGVEIKTIEDYAEALIAASHAICKERIYTLNDYFTVERWMNSRTVKLARELECENIIKVAVNLNRRISGGLLETPYKIPLPLWMTMLMQKFWRDSLTRATSICMLRTLTGRRVGKLLISRLMRETY